MRLAHYGSGQSSTGRCKILGTGTSYGPGLWLGAKPHMRDAEFRSSSGTKEWAQLGCPPDSLLHSSATDLRQLLG